MFFTKINKKTEDITTKNLEDDKNRGLLNSMSKLLYNNKSSFDLKVFVCLDNGERQNYIPMLLIIPLNTVNSFTYYLFLTVSP